jgi:Acetyltransferase (GNAT) domain
MATAAIRTLSVRALAGADLADTGRLLHEAFARVTRAHGFTPPFASAEEGERLARAYLHLDPEGAVVATDGGAVVGCGFVHVRGRVASIGPVAAAPRAVAGVGGAVMQRLLAIAHEVPSVRLFQDAFNARSFALYSKLGFRIHETVAVVACPTPRLPPPRTNAWIRPMEDADMAEVAELDEATSGNSRARDLEVLRSIAPALVAEQGGRVVGFLFVHRAPGRSYLGPAVAPDLGDLLALMSTAASAGGAFAMRVPTGAMDLLREILTAGFQVEQLGNVMVRGSEPPPAIPRLLAVFPEGL